jgi:hypothetical protein
MVRIKSTLIAATSLLALFAATTLTPAQFGDSKPGVDPELRRSLQELGYEHQVYDDGSVLVMVPTEDGYKAPVIITKAQTTSDGVRFRIMMVPVKAYDGQGPANLEATVHQVSQGMPIGILKTVQMNGKTVVIYAAPLPVAPSTDTLGTFLRGATKSASQAARKLNIA